MNVNREYAECFQVYRIVALIMRMNVDVVSTGSSTKVVFNEVQKERLGWEGRIPVAFELEGERFRATVVHTHGQWCFVTNPRMRERVDAGAAVHSTSRDQNRPLD